MTNHLEVSNSQDVQCSWKFEGKGTTKNGNSIGTERSVNDLVANKEKICESNQEKFEERKLAFECNFVNNPAHTNVSVGNNTQQLCFTSRIDFYGTMGENIDCKLISVAFYL